MSGPDPNPVESLIESLRPELSRIATTGWALLGLTTVVTVAILVLIPEWRDAWLQIGIFAIVFGPVIAAFIIGWARRQQETLIMPHLARSIGFHYEPDPAHFRDRIPPRLLPRAARRRVEDLIEGPVGGRTVEMAEVKVETGGKNSTTLFKGIVVRFPNAVPMPAFFIAPERQTRGLFGTRGNIRVDDLVSWGNRERWGTLYGIWISPEAARNPHPALQAVLDTIIESDRHVQGDMDLFSASSDGTVTHLAFTNPRNLFAIGGLFANRDRLLSDIRRASEDLAIPLRFVTAILAAEEKAAATSPG